MFFFNFPSGFSQNKIDTSKFVFVKGSFFRPGSEAGDDDEKKSKIIYIKSFYISKYEINNAEFCKFLNDFSLPPEKISHLINIGGQKRNIKCAIFFENGIYKSENGYENFPVIFVSWHGANAFCKYAGGRLPNEIEWEYAAKGGKKNKDFFLYSGSNSADLVAWFGSNSQNKIHKCGLKKPNCLNIFDMSGNISEWCFDKYNPKFYNEMKRFNPKEQNKGNLRVHRGASWINSEKILRLTNRRASKPETKNSTIGFRIVHDF